MINYTEKGIGLHEAIRKAGHWLRDENGMWVSDNDAAVQALIDSYDPIPAARMARIATIKADGLQRMNHLFPALTSLDEVSFYAEFWTSIASAARAPTVNFTKIIAIYTAAKNAVIAVNGATTQVLIDAVAPAWPA